MKSREELARKTNPGKASETKEIEGKQNSTEKNPGKT
jgi:hypothetical protein